jgi:hypothetical protein
MKKPGNNVTRFSDRDPVPLARLLARFGLELRQVPPGQSIPGSFWGDEEAGLIGSTLFVRPDTPLHSLLHEACHFICMNESRRIGLDTDAGGDYDEENAVCFLQILLADEIPAFGRAGMMRDMDAWGYTFRLGSAQAWFENDAGDALEWLSVRGLVTAEGRPSFMVRSER